ncbi:MAG: SUF system NifU family Fe-S cluster assembly protein [Bacilli bacterium]|nr:SUF system NifU family Fe-S cluster assembly protein [Bacilli bacterium]
MDSNIKRELILDNFNYPNNKGLTNDPSYIKKSNKNPSCIDHFDIELKIEDGIVKDIRFDGEACAIATSSLSIAIHRFIGKSKEEVLNIIDNYKKMVNEEEYDSSILEDLLAFDEIWMQESRKTCATLGVNIIEDILKNN